MFARKLWKVKLKFRIAFFIGDTELHDKLCGRYLTYNDKVQMLCRHCDCPTKNIVKIDKQTKNVLFKPSDFVKTMRNITKITSE